MTSVQGIIAYSVILSLVCLVTVPNLASAGGYGWNPGSSIVTRVRYNEPEEKHIHVTHEVHHVVHRRKRPHRRRKVVAVLEEPEPIVVPRVTAHANHHHGLTVSGLEGSYVAVAGEHGRGSVHVVENVPALGHDSVVVVNGARVRTKGHRVAVQLEPALEPAVPPPVPHPSLLGGRLPPALPDRQPTHSLLPGQHSDGVSGDRLPLPKCSYVNTDFPGDDLYDDDYDNDNDDGVDYRRRRGVNAGSARACKSLCRLDDDCQFWTYKEGFNRDTTVRDCFLKRGTPGLPVPREAVPRIGFVSGTKDNSCVCIMSDDEEDEVCPLKDPKGLVYPWRSTDQEEDDLARGLLPTGWRRVGSPYYPGLSGGDGSLVDEVRRLRDQIDDLQSRLADS